MNPKHLFYALILTLLSTLFALPAAAQSTASKPLAETFVSDDENLTFRYPSGWVIQNDRQGQVVIATDESLFSLSADKVSSGQGALGILFLDQSSDQSELLVLGDDPISILNSLVKMLFEQGDTHAELETPEATTLNDHAAARVDGTFDGNAIFLMLVDQGDKNYVLYVGITAASEMPKFEPKLLAIAESVHYVPSTSS
jgi:hypothetical protein